ncbi:MAG: PQQ-binding-like beta-propeller repeat protein, partial [Chloroflexi bacterium]|nr:PQQ-binding-like beta-propeller repeat protein [Chloroflexota bacterium]
MKRWVVALVVAATLLLPNTSWAQSGNQPTFRSPTQDELTKAVAGANNWITAGGALDNQRYSTLDQINANNVANLKGSWMARLGSGKGPKYKFEADPLVIDGVMYLATGNDDVFALDATTGRKLWSWQSDIPQDIATVCCGWDNRGVASGQGMIYLGLLDGSFAALDQKTGKLVWRTQLEDYHNGYGITGAARFYDGLVFTGMSGGEFGIRGRVYALDAKTGQEVWRFYTVAGPNDVGGDSWPNDGVSYLHGGGTVWQAPAIDPELGMLYFSTGNTGSWRGSQRPGDNLFTSSIVALDYKTGQYKWHFQQVHHDLWDLDSSSPVVLFDQTYNGQPRKGLYECSKTGWCYLLDRTNGQPLTGITEKPVPQEPRQLTAPTQPYPDGDAFVNQCAAPVEGFPVTGCMFTPYWDVPVMYRPALDGAATFNPMAYSPQTGFIYALGHELQLTLSVKPADLVTGRWWIETTVGVPPGAPETSTITALDSRNNKIVWQQRHDGSDSKGDLTTAGGLLFLGGPDGNFKALDATSGNELWSFQVGWGIGAPPMTYSVNGDQYVAVASGGNVGGNTTLDGDAVWAFKLNGTIDQVAAPPPIATKNAAFGGPPVMLGQPLQFPFGQTSYDKVNFDGTLYVDDFTFTAAKVQVPVGTTITWHNNGPSTHTATDSQGQWDTGDILAGQDASITFNTAGTFNYSCTPHPWML